MILPILSYGSPLLRKECDEFQQGESLKELVSNMFETMYASKGVGLAAPQIGMSKRIFVVDGSPFSEDVEEELSAQLKNFKRAFVNPVIIDETGDSWSYEEGCLSIPGIHEKIFRLREIRFRSQNSSGDWIEEKLSGLSARIFQHEYDHIEGVLFPDRMSPLKRRMLQGRLKNISVGKVDTTYRMKLNVK